MPKKPRVVVADVPYHITARANKGEFIFKSDAERERYVDFVVQYSQKYSVKIFAWCIMGNHVHFVMEPSTEEGLSKLFAVVQQRFSRYLNRMNRTYGRNWQERFYSTAMDKEHLYHAIRYVELNPVRAKITDGDGIFSYTWSSASGRFTGEQKIPIDGVEEHLEIDDWKLYLMGDEDEVIIKKILDNQQEGLPSGSPMFVRMMEKLTDKVLAKGKAGRKRK